ncbi:MAG: hypothetical protein EU541_06030 [Promethearchaeota archaeon]|nr:MAG: hypothetical protein EU541_06030 [Candidatus Lokiarchaeota archaeon]
MNYCPHCNNLLIPKGDKFVCRICNRKYILTENEEEEYEVVRVLKDSKDVDIIIEEDTQQEISKKEREAYEEKFGTVEE